MHICSCIYVYLSPIYDSLGVLLAQLNAQLKLLKARPGSLIVQLDSNPYWRSREAGGIDVTELYRDIYSRYQQYIGMTIALYI